MFFWKSHAEERTYFGQYLSSPPPPDTHTLTQNCVVCSRQVLMANSVVNPKTLKGMKVWCQLTGTHIRAYRSSTVSSTRGSPSRPRNRTIFMCSSEEEKREANLQISASVTQLGLRFPSSWLYSKITSSSPDSMSLLVAKKERKKGGGEREFNCVLCWGSGQVYFLLAMPL